jgi:phage shock protein A
VFNMIRTLIRGRVADSADVVESSNALPILRQQLREAAEGVASGRRAVAVVMAYAERERKNAGQLRSQIGDIEARAIDALTKGREDLATEAASTIANLEAELAATEKTIVAYDSEIAGMRRVLADAEARLMELQRGQRLATATDQTQKLRTNVPHDTLSPLARAESTLSKLQDRQAHAEATRAAMGELSTTANAATMRDKLAAAGCGDALRPETTAVLERLRAKAA